MSTQHTHGFATLEIIIALAVLSLSLSAVVMLTTGNQSFAIDTTLAQRALWQTQNDLLLTTRASVHDLTPPQASTQVFLTDHTTHNISACAWRIESTTAWQQGQRHLDTSLTTIVTDPAASTALGHDCAAVASTEDWQSPKLQTKTTLDQVLSISAVDAVNDRLYLAVTPATSSAPSFYSLSGDESSDSLAVEHSLITGSSLNDLDVAGSVAYLATNDLAGHIQIVDLSPTFASPTAPPTILHTISLPGVDATGSFPEARSLYYYDERLYVGTRETKGPEFHIFAVSSLSPTSPPQHLGSLELTHSIRDIVVRHDNATDHTYAYLATTDNQRELMVIDVTDPSNLIHPDVSRLGTDLPGSNNASTLFVGNTHLFLGREQSSQRAPELYVLDTSAVLDSTSTTDGTISAYSLDLRSGREVTSLTLTDSRLFLTTDDPHRGLVILDTTDLSSLQPASQCASLSTLDAVTSGDLGATANQLFLSHDATLSVVHNSTSVCEP